ncbi:hypothetical protein [Penaeicola halotolerans]|uniref:hypothetical protein n=1 Tax=Penaeicola halotolerans TaxID=2793196 RepID=UPI001CF91862|nr:hypothetical protein [Penaeicola halotolerans]
MKKIVLGCFAIALLSTSCASSKEYQELVAVDKRYANSQSPMAIAMSESRNAEKLDKTAEKRIKKLNSRRY